MTYFTQRQMLKEFARKFCANATCGKRIVIPYATMHNGNELCSEPCYRQYILVERTKAARQIS